ncbi:hypothetical protein BLS_003927 [Venturia inaequalis]|uniref:Major facilitator superfamily (MFS) profile domain-containing protein n=1 Tax=Venturia inaequalis TaxID=5025 RepID=A0A8H3YT33_VENIN|nr:hypothetical protein BLS_003927 [Venturia inaequalis]
MTDTDNARLAAASIQSPSSESIANSTSSGKTLRDEDKDLENWSSNPSPRQQTLNQGKDNDYDDEGSDEDDHLLTIQTTPPPESNTIPSPLIFEEEQKRPVQKKTATWKSLPRKGQLALLTISRLAEPLTQTSLQSYMFYQLKSFDTSQTDPQISVQAGMLAAAFTAAQFVTAIPWGRAADSEVFGRKRVLIIGLVGTMVSAVGFGFSRGFYTAMFFRTLGGALNGNVGVMRTMISEIIKEKKFQTRAFMLLPMTFNIGVIIGPVLGGVLSDPIRSYPHLFGNNSTIGGRNGVWWMKQWPYALPNLVSAMFLLSAAILLFLGLEETHEVLRYQPDRGRAIGTWVIKNIFRRRQDTAYSSIPTSDELGSPADADDVELQCQSHSKKHETIKRRQKLPLRRIWTRNVIITLTAHATLALHVGTFNSLWFVFLSTPRYNAKHPHPSSLHHPSFPLHFNGGLALPPARIGLALSILGIIGICIQLFLYPSWSGRLGLVRSYRYSLLLFPIAYTLAPYLAILPSSTPPPLPANGIVVWIGITTVLAIQVMARTFALPATNILVNNACPHPSVLGTFHGIAQSVSSLSRTFGPAVAGWLYGRGLIWGVVGTGFWFLAIAAVVNNFAACFVRDADGHEIVLEGEEEEVRGNREHDR